MCGIVGFINVQKKWGKDQLDQHIQRMTQTLAHRGPDSSGIWTDPDSGIALGHARLAILDLSPKGHQPMQSQNGKYIITYNGEIYNYKELTKELQQFGAHFYGSSDTEVLLEAITQWGVVNTLKKCNGMFSFALWSKEERKLIIARDRMGKKPLYYGWSKKSFIFSSELQALRAFPDFYPEINRDALAAYFRHSYIPTPYSIYTGINKLEAGCIAIITPEKKRTEIQPYWSLQATAQHGISHPLDISEKEAIDLLDDQIKKSVELRLVSDVPLGAFLSGGIDSSTVVAQMHRLIGNKTKTFTIGYEEKRFNEAPFARAIAKYLGTEHTELQVKADDVLNTIPTLANVYDEPFADVSQLPTYIVCKLARQTVTVSLSGDGGDELFCGYDRYFSALKKWDRIASIPFGLRKCGSDLLHPASKLFPENDWLSRSAALLKCQNATNLFLLRSERMHNAETLVCDSQRLPPSKHQLSAGEISKNPLEQMMFIDTAGWLMDDILVKMDRASMANSLEVRNPLLDPDFIALAFSIPLQLKTKDSQRKYILKQSLLRHLPKELIERPKRGFAVPISDWLRGPLKDWAEHLIQISSDQDMLNHKTVKWLWNQFQKGNNRYRMAIWSILMFLAWEEQNNTRMSNGEN